jgi:hypothetical protein
MKRWHQELAVTKRNWREHRKIHVESNKTWQREVGKDPYEVDCACDDQIGRFRKKDAYDCGNTRCYICHSDKLPKRSLHEQEQLADLDFREQIGELYENR